MHKALCLILRTAKKKLVCDGEVKEGIIEEVRLEG
jgi:hypothetical protein